MRFPGNSSEGKNTPEFLWQVVTEHLLRTQPRLGPGERASNQTDTVLATL